MTKISNIFDSFIIIKCPFLQEEHYSFIVLVLYFKSQFTAFIFYQIALSDPFIHL